MDSLRLKPGSTLRGGTYKIIRTLGQGGFGITYLAEHVLLAQKVAVKEFFMKDFCDRFGDTSRMTIPTQNSRQFVEKFKGKFIREARMIFPLEHPNIVRVLDVFEENDTAYYVMDNLPGGSLADMVKAQGHLSEADAVKYVRQVASALDYIHKRNLVHLDVKPSNILLNAHGDAVLIDFGISKHYDNAGEQTSSTPVGNSKGFAPLEQGKDGDVSQFKAATDIYALGATLYNLIVGSVPPDASTVFDNGLARPVGVSDLVWNAISKSMQPRRADRPQSISEFLALLDGSPSVAKPVIPFFPGGSEETVVEPVADPAPAPTPVPPAPQKSNNTAIIAAVIAAATVILSVVIYTSGSRKSRQDNSSSGQAAAVVETPAASASSASTASTASTGSASTASTGSATATVTHNSGKPSGTKIMTGYMYGNSGVSEVKGAFHFEGNKITGQYGYLGKTYGIRVEGTMLNNGTFTADEWNEYTGEHCGSYVGTYTSTSLKGTFKNYAGSQFTFELTLK